MTCSVLVVRMPSPVGCASTKTWETAASFVEQGLAEVLGIGVLVPASVEEPVP